MQSFLRIALILLISFAAFAEPWTQWRNSLQPKGKSVEFVVARDGKSTCAILVSPEPTTQEKKAAEDLQHWLKLITGADISIVDQVPTVQKCISVGNTSLAAADRSQDLKEEGYSIATADGHLVLRGGRTRGIINAVYALLEEDLGCRWYTHTDIRLPHDSSLKMNVVPRTYVPQLRLRDPFWFVAFDGEWSLWNRTNAPRAAVKDEWGGHMDYGPGLVHTSATLLPPDKYFNEHPEYFMLDGAGKRQPYQWCPTDPNVVRIVTQAVRDTLKAQPNLQIISVSKNDSGGDQLCQCERCKALRNAEGAEMATQLFLVNKVAEDIEKDYPNVAIDTLAYLDTIGVPKTVRPRKNVVIRLCNDTVGAWSHPFTPASQLPAASIAKAWSKACDRIYIWDYHVNFSHYLAPMPNMGVIASNIRFWVANHAEGVMLQAGYESTAERDEQKSWVSAKLLWDSRLDENELTQDFIFGHYGKAASMIAEYDALLVKAGKDHAKDLESPGGGIRYEMTNPFLSKEFLDQSMAIFAKAEAAVVGDAEMLRRVQRAELPVLYVRMTRGPQFVGPTFAKELDAFERIAKREKATHTAEGYADTFTKIAAWRKQITKGS